MYRIILLDFVKFLAGLASLAVLVLTEHEVVPLIVIALLLGFSAFPKMRRCQAYLTGWVEGRRAMVGSLREAQDRDMPLLSWIEAELDRTLAAVGVEVMHSVPAERPED